jgi:hypothetical protein
MRGQLLDQTIRLQDGVQRAVQRRNAEIWPNLSREARRRQRLNITGDVYRGRQWETALRLQRASPANGYLSEFSWLSVETPNRSIPVQAIVRTRDPRFPPRTEDIMEFRVDGRIQPYETKASRTLIQSYSTRGGVEEARFRRSSTVARQIRKTARIVDYARRNNGRLRGAGYTIDGRRVEVVLDPADVLPTIVSPYGGALD